MEFSRIFMISCSMLLLCSSLASCQAASPPAPAAMNPNPTPAPVYVNLTCSVAGPFHTFLNYLESTKVMDTFQNQANNSAPGIMIFVPKDSAFMSLKKPSLSNLGDDQLKSLILFHAMPKIYSLADFNDLSAKGPSVHSLMANTL